MHNHNDKKQSSMMWMMLACCVLPFAVLLFFNGTFFSDGYFLPILLGVCVISHLVMMFRGHHGHTEADLKEQAEEDGKSKTARKHKHDGCCN